MNFSLKVPLLCRAQVFINWMDWLWTVWYWRAGCSFYCTLCGLNASFFSSFNQSIRRTVVVMCFYTVWFHFIFFWISMTSELHINNIGCSRCIMIARLYWKICCVLVEHFRFGSIRFWLNSVRWMELLFTTRGFVQLQVRLMLMTMLLSFNLSIQHI